MSIKLLLLLYLTICFRAIGKGPSVKPSQAGILLTWLSHQAFNPLAHVDQDNAWLTPALVQSLLP